MSEQTITALELRLRCSTLAARSAVRVPGKPYPAEVPDDLLIAAADEIHRLRQERVTPDAGVREALEYEMQSEYEAAKLKAQKSNHEYWLGVRDAYFTAWKTIIPTALATAHSRHHSEPAPPASAAPRGGV